MGPSPRPSAPCRLLSAVAAAASAAGCSRHSPPAGAAAACSPPPQPATQAAAHVHVFKSLTCRSKLAWDCSSYCTQAIIMMMAGPAHRRAGIQRTLTTLFVPSSRTSMARSSVPRVARSPASSSLLRASCLLYSASAAAVDTSSWDTWLRSVSTCETASSSSQGTQT